MRRQALQVLAAAGMDALTGDPPDRLHPVCWTGRIIGRLEECIYPRSGGYAGGTMLAGLTLGAVSLPLLPFFAGSAKGKGRAGVLAGAAIIDSTLSFRQLTGRCREIRLLLENGRLEEARERVGEMVGRDTQGLSSEEVVRAAVETLAENASDGVFAPLLYALAGGPAAAFLYRTLNTLDSMVGYRDDRYGRFGWASARLDDLANLLPSRVTAAFLLLGGTACGKDMLQSVKIMRRDAPAHASPNAGWPEAAMAGLLGVRLGGLNCYGGVPHRGAGLGDRIESLEPAKIGEASRILAAAYLIFLGLVALGVFTTHGRTG